MTLKTPYCDGTTHVVALEDIIARLAALVPKARAHLTKHAYGKDAAAQIQRSQISSEVNSMFFPRDGVIPFRQNHIYCVSRQRHRVHRF